MSFYLKYPNSEVTTIMLTVYIEGGKRVKYSTRKKIKPEYWDLKKKRPKVMRGIQGQRNRDLEVILNEVSYAVANIKEMYGPTLTPLKLRQKLDEYFNRTDYEIITVAKVYTSFLEEKKALFSVTSQTLQAYSRCYSNYLEYDTKNAYRLEDLDNAFYVGFITFLRQKKELSNNTLYRRIGYFKTFLNWATEKGYNVNKDYKKVKISTNETNDISLTTQDIEKLEGLELDKRLGFYRDLFLIGVYSGQRFSDYSVFNKDDVQDGFIVKRAEKTETFSYIPLHPKLKTLLDRYDWTLGKISGQKFNKNIQAIAKLAGFDEVINKTSYIGVNKVEKKAHRWQIVTSHTARRTFITIASEKNMPQHVLMNITGIKDPKTLKKYTKINKAVIKEEAFKVFG